MIRTALLVVIGVSSVFYLIACVRAVRTRAERLTFPSALHIAIGVVTDFLDTLGIGSFATTTTSYRLLRVVPDEKLVGTMLVGHALPVIAQAFIFLVVVQVDTVVLVALVVACVVGAWFGAGVSSRLPRRAIQATMGVGLLAAASFMLMSQLGAFPVGGEALTLPPVKLAVALVANFALGVLAMMGIGNYAPSLILFSMLGMDPRAAFPIMMTSGATMAMAGGIRFVTANRFDARAALGLTLGGVPAVLVAGLVVKSLPLGVLRWMVVAVVGYAAIALLRSAMSEKAPPGR